MNRIRKNMSRFMQINIQENEFSYSSPICLLEELFFDFEWNYERDSETEIAAEIEGRWCNYRLYAMWRQDLESLMISSLIDVKIPQDKNAHVVTLLTAINPKIWLGHF